MKSTSCGIRLSHFGNGLPFAAFLVSAFRQRFRVVRETAAAALGLLIGSVASFGAEALDNWEQTAPGKFAPLFSGVSFGKEIFVAVGANGLLATSPDGFQWTAQNHGQDAQYRSVVFAQDKFVAVGQKTPVIESADGITWIPDPSGKKYDMYGIAYGNGTFVAVGFVGGIWTSPNGHDWTARTSGTFSRLHSVAFGNGLFVATGLSGTILTSPTGEVWTPQASNTTDALFSITFANGTFVAATSKSAIVTSPNGLDWTNNTIGGGSEFKAVTWGNGIFIVVGFGFVTENGAHLWTSPDAITWTRRNSNVTRTLNGVAFGNGRFVAVGEEGNIIRSGVLGAPEEGAVIQEAKRNGDAMQFIFSSQPDRSYEVQYSTNFTGWTKIRTITAFGPITSFSELVHGAPSRFYRVLKLPQ